MTQRDPHKLALWAVLGLMCAGLLATAIPGAFIIDEANYIASVTGLRDGSLMVPTSNGMPASPELLGFDAAPRSRTVLSTPVASSAPPLYAALALPFAPLGPRGLIALNILAFAICGALVFTYVRGITERVSLAWFALATFVLACFALEYAQGIWPHTLSMALVMGAVELARRVRAGASPWLAAGVGACACFSAGLRYQNVAIVAMIGLGLLLFGHAVRAHRLKIAVAFALGCVPVLAVSGVMNHTRYGSWNPLSKGPGYLSLGGGESTSIAAEAVVSTWSRIADFTAWPGAAPGSDIAVWMPKQETSGAFLMAGAVKKALLQSAPWAVVPLLAIVLALVRRTTFPDAPRRELQSMALVILGVIGMFAVFGFRRYDAFCFNQRYFLELMPLLAAGLAIAIAPMEKLPSRALAIGALVCGVSCLAILSRTTGGGLRESALMKFPLVLALAIGAAWMLHRRARISATAFAAVLGAGLGWALVVHLGDDLPASRRIRAANAARLEDVAAAIDPAKPSVLVAYWGSKDAFGPLPLTHDLLVVDPWIDDGATFATVINAALDQGRAVYIVLPVPRSLQRQLAEMHTRGRPVAGASGLIEIAR